MLIINLKHVPGLEMVRNYLYLPHCRDFDYFYHLGLCNPHCYRCINMLDLKRFLLLYLNHLQDFLFKVIIYSNILYMKQ